MAREHPKASAFQGNPERTYYNDDERVLVNRLGLVDHATLTRKEGDLFYRAVLTVIQQREGQPSIPLSAEFLRHVHREIFADLYDWAGQWRTVNIAKGPMRWPPASFLDATMSNLEREVFSKYPPQILQNSSVFSKALAHIQGEYLAVHPFREGNTRTIMLCSNVLALQAGRPPLVYDLTAESKAKFDRAELQAICEADYKGLESLIDDALCRGHALVAKLSNDRQEASKERISNPLSRALNQLSELHRNTSDRQTDPLHDRAPKINR